MALTEVWNLLDPSTGSSGALTCNLEMHWPRKSCVAKVPKDYPNFGVWWGDSCQNKNQISWTGICRMSGIVLKCQGLSMMGQTQLGTAWESNDQTNRRIPALARRSAICWMAERRTVKGSGLCACWKGARLVLHGFAWTPKTHTLCVRILKRDHETLQWSFRTLSVYFGSTITYVGWWKGLPEGWFAIDSWALFSISAHGWQHGT